MQNLQTIAKVTAKGQITIPKAIRKALEIELNSKMLFVLEKNEVRLSCLNNNADPAIEKFLAIIEKDINNAKNIGKLSDNLLAAMQKSMKNKNADDITGEVNL